jgi:hypothetical protein
MRVPPTLDLTVEASLNRPMVVDELLEKFSGFVSCNATVTAIAGRVGMCNAEQIAKFGQEKLTVCPLRRAVLDQREMNASADMSRKSKRRTTRPKD